MTHGFIRLKQTKNGKAPALPFNETLWSVVAGQCVSHSPLLSPYSGLDVGSGLHTGKTLCMGSRQSDTYLRIYANCRTRGERTAIRGFAGKWNGKAEWGHGSRHGLVVTHSRPIPPVHRRGVSQCVDFRDCTWADDPKDRYYAPLLDWWQVHRGDAVRLG